MFTILFHSLCRGRFLRATPVLLGSLLLWVGCDATPSALETDGPLAPGSQFAKGGKKGPPGGGTTASTIVSFSNRAGDNIRSDGRGSYADGVCGVLADFNLTDARLDPDASRIKRKQKSTCGDPRALVFEWDQPDDGGPTKATRVDGIFMNVDQVETETGTNVPHIGQFNVCNRLIFNPDDPFVGPTGSDSLLVSFNDQGNADPADDTWTVRTQPFPNDKGFCVGDGRLWHMPFELTIRRK
ncbi:MAG: hypothetical protein ACE5HP_12935 [Gemmatimonadota bacterium]